MNRLFLFALAAGLSIGAASAQTSFINEFHYDNSGPTDTGEAIEVVVPTGTDVSNYEIVRYNGSNGAVYTSNPGPASFPAASATAVNGLVDIYVINYPSNGLQNGAPDGFALVDNGVVIQFLSYEGSFTAVGGAADGMTSTDIGQSETNSTDPGLSLQLAGSGNSYNAFSWQDDATSTFGAANTNQVFSASAIFDGPGWRLVSAPGTGLDVDDLAAVNLVQGITGQYPTADPNFFNGYAGAGTGSYATPGSSTSGLTPGQGIMWYWFDSAFGPFAGGTSSSVELSGFSLPTLGTELVADHSTSLADNADAFYMIGNPFQQPFDVAGITETGTGTLGASFLAYDPSLGLGSTGATSGGYVELTAGDEIAVWQGVFAEVTGAPSPGTADFTFAAASRNASGTPVFYGREARPTTFALMLNGEVTVGDALYPVVDAVTKARFRDGATTGFDRFDLSELAPPNGIQASLAFATERDGEAHRLAVHSMPETLKGSVTLPVEFASTAPGTFTLSGELVSIPEGWTASLRDLVSGDIVDLTGGESHTFTTDTPTEWTPRFELVVVASSSVATEGEAEGFEMGLVTPNPAVASATLSLRVDAPQFVTATVVDALGRVVQTPFAGELAPSTDAQLSVDTAVLAPGTYVVRVEGETFAQSRRLTVVR